MTFTVSHRQAGVTRQNVGGLIRHNFRDVDKRNGMETRHSNELIDPERTKFNESFLWINGKAKPISGSNEIIDELERRVSRAGQVVKRKDGTIRKRAIRKDSRVVREIVLQLDPDFTGNSKDIIKSDRSEFNNYMGVLFDHYADLYGSENLLASSLHLDETSPHMHLLVTPIDKQGRVRQESFLRGPQDMRKNDRDLRKRLKDAGYDVDPEPRGAGRGHLTKAEYGAWREREDQVARDRQALDERTTKINMQVKRINGNIKRDRQALEDREKALEKRKDQVARDRQILDERSRSLDERTTKINMQVKRINESIKRDRQALEDREKALEKREEAIAAGEQEAAKERQRLAQQSQDLNGRESALEARESALEAREKDLPTREALKAAYEADRAAFQRAMVQMGRLEKAIRNHEIKLDPRIKPKVNAAIDNVYTTIGMAKPAFEDPRFRSAQSKSAGYDGPDF